MLRLNLFLVYSRDVRKIVKKKQISQTVSCFRLKNQRKSCEGAQRDTFDPSASSARKELATRQSDKYSGVLLRRE